MVNQQMLEGQWNEIRGKLKQRWGQLTDDDLRASQGNVDELIGTIQQKTGASREEVESYLNDLTSQAAAKMQQATEAAQQYGQRAAETAQEYRQRAAEAAQQYSEQATAVARHYRQQAGARFQEGYSQAEAMIHERPAESMAVAFGAGLVAGVLVGLSLRSR